MSHYSTVGFDYPGTKSILVVPGLSTALFLSKNIGVSRGTLCQYNNGKDLIKRLRNGFKWVFN